MNQILPWLMGLLSFLPGFGHAGPQMWNGYVEEDYSYAAAASAGTIAQIAVSEGQLVRKGDLLCVVDTQEDVLLYMGRFMQYYRENAKYLERTHGMVDRLGIDYLRSVLVDDSEGICARLDQEMQAAVDAYQDPWQEAEAPVTPYQFTSVVESVQPAGVR